MVRIVFKILHPTAGVLVRLQSCATGFGPPLLTEIYAEEQILLNFFVASLLRSCLQMRPETVHPKQLQDANGYIVRPALFAALRKHNP